MNVGSNKPPPNKLLPTFAPLHGVYLMGLYGKSLQKMSQMYGNHAKI